MHDGALPLASPGDPSALAFDGRALDEGKYRDEREAVAALLAARPSPPKTARR